MHQTCKHAMYVLNTLHQCKHEWSIICCLYFDLCETSCQTKLRVVRWAVCRTNQQPRTTTLAAPYCAHDTSSETNQKMARASLLFIDNQTFPQPKLVAKLTL